MGTREVLLAAVTPTLVSLVVLVVLHRLLGPGLPAGKGSAGKPGRSLSWAVPPLVAGGVVLGSWVWQSRVELWAQSVTHRFPAIALAGLAAGLVTVFGSWVISRSRREDSEQAPPRVLPAVAAVAGMLGGGFAAWAVLEGLHESLIGEAARWGWVAGVGLIAGAQSWAIEVGSRALPGWRGPGVLWLVLGTAALGATAGFANAPLLLWPASGVALAVAAVGVVRREVNLLAGSGPVFAVVLSGVGSFSHWMGDTERWVMFALLMACPLPLALAGLKRLGRRRGLRLAIAGGLSICLVGVQAGIAVPALVRATTGGDSYGY